ncbi:MAG: GH3 auxin-responsive promoter family protein [Pseudomonadota bacterium]|nr:GH3 auxin-responsive promoter family protein [Pseudomonadota bacterium]
MAEAGWATLPDLARRLPPAPSHAQWLTEMLARNRHCAWLRAFGSPATLADYRARVPLCSHDDMAPWIARALAPGARDVLFAGAPVGCERTGGSTSGPKLIAYSAAGLQDAQRALLPWLADLAQRHALSGTAYFATSPATRAPERVGALPLGLPDGAWLGPQAGAVLAARSAVPLEVGALTDVAEWRHQTLAHLRAAQDLELISVWSPTFLLTLLDDLPDAAALWPRLKLVSCWASGASARYIPALAERLPHARIQPKGLLATEGVVTVPDAHDLPVLTRHGFFEFAQGDSLYLADELRVGESYEVVLTNANGLYRYRLGDHLRCTGFTLAGDPLLELQGRLSLASDLVGEKLTESFAADCLHPIQGFAMLIADADATPPAYRLVCEHPPAPTALAAVEAALQRNPQYAYARRMGQLQATTAWHRPRAWAQLTQTLLARGTRLADVKPLALRGEAAWAMLFRDAG